MALPTATDVKTYLVGIDTSSIPDSWITDRRDGYVIPYLEDYLEISFKVNKLITEFYSGNGTRLLTLDRTGILSGLKIIFPHTDAQDITGSTSFVHDPSTGQVHRPIIRDIGATEQVWPKGSKNIKVTYNLGFAPADDLKGEAPELFELIILLLATRTLKQIQAGEDSSGGGSLSVEGYSKSKGEALFKNTVKQIAGDAKALIQKFNSGVVGS